MTSLVAAPAATALANMNREATTDRSRLGQLLLILVLDPLLQDLPTALAPIHKRRIELLIYPPRRLTMPMPAVLPTRPPTRTTSRTAGRLAA